MAYLGKGRSEVLFVLATELNLEFDKSMTIATLKDLIIGSENYDEELTKNIHSTIVEDRKAREKKQEEQKEKLHIEEREEKLRIEQLRLDEQKRKDEFELEKLRIQTQSNGSTVSLLRENTSRRVMDPTKLSKNKMLLTGIGVAQVTNIGSFEHEFEIDNENYSLTWHAVPADKLKFEAVIGSDLLEHKHR
ncbi:RVP domain-containing protein [Trichonephila clavipes]|nr:RVP domain-containing protein [Trichonephila clavipes]